MSGPSFNITQDPSHSVDNMEMRLGQLQLTSPIRIPVKRSDVENHILPRRLSLHKVCDLWNFILAAFHEWVFTILFSFRNRIIFVNCSATVSIILMQKQKKMKWMSYTRILTFIHYYLCDINFNRGIFKCLKSHSYFIWSTSPKMCLLACPFSRDTESKFFSLKEEG